MDPAIIGPTVRHLEQYRAYYQFNTRTTSNRYNDQRTDARHRGVACASSTSSARDAASWQNTTSSTRTATAWSRPPVTSAPPTATAVFLEQAIPGTGFLTDRKYEPRIYFGEQSPPYSIVGGPEGGEPIELDYPLGADGGHRDAPTFTGTGGPSVGNVFNRLNYALKFQSEQILFSDNENPDSQIPQRPQPRRSACRSSRPT